VIVIFHIVGGGGVEKKWEKGSEPGLSVEGGKRVLIDGYDSLYIV